MDRPCDIGPAFVVPYFNTSDYVSNFTADGTYDGYTTMGSVYNVSVCVKTNIDQYFCTIEDELVYVAETITSNDWNRGVDGGAGSVGFGNNSPVWAIVGSPTIKQFDAYLANFN